jgi:uncharacterized membrane protein
MVATFFFTLVATAPASAAVTVDCGRGINLSFEDPAIPDTWRLVAEGNVPGWETHAPDGLIEFWVDGFLGVSAPDGGQITELKANGPAATYQDIPTAEGDVITWSVDHKGRNTTDTTNVRIGAPGSETTVQTIVTSPAAWATYTGTYTVPASQSTTRFMLDPIGGGSIGNLMDNVVLALTCGLDATTASVIITDTDASGNDTAGDVATVTIDVTNTGTATLLDVDVTDGGADTAVCTDNILVPGESTTCTTTHTLDQVDVDSGGFAGSATVGGHDAANVPISDAAIYSIALSAMPDFAVDLEASLDLSITDPVARADVGDTVTYTGTVTNTGNVTLSDVAVSTDVAGSHTCAATVLAPGESTTCTATHSLIQGDIDNGDLDAIGSFFATPAQGSDLAGSDTVNVVLDREPELEVELGASTLMYDAVGATIDLTVTVTNVGNTTVTDIDVSHDVPSGTALDCGAMPFDLAPGEERSCSASLTITQDDLDAGEIVGRATATGTEPSVNPVADTSDPLTLSADQQPSITLDTSSTVDPSIVSPISRHDAGDEVAVTYAIENTGNVTLSGIVLTGPLGSPIVCSEASLAPAETHVCTVNVDVSQSDIDTGSVDASATVEATAPDSSTISADDDHAVTFDQDPAIDITTTVDGVTSHGDGTYTVLYTVTVSNTGNTSLTGIDVQDGLNDTFPHATITLTDPATDSFLPATVLAPGSSLVAIYSVLVQADGVSGPYNTVSTVTALSPADDVSAAAAAEVTLDVTYDLTVSIDAPASAAPGSSYTQKITVMNKGPAVALGPVLVSLTLDPSASFQAFSGEGWNCSAAGNQVTCSYEDKINAGVSTDVSIVMLVNAAVGESLTFSASVGAANNENDVNPLNNVLAIHLSVDQLPETGVSSDRLAFTGLLLLLLGSALVIGTRKSKFEELS